MSAPLKQHPLGKVFPPLDAEALKELQIDIAKNGLRNPIIMFEGMVLDGWNRYLACDAANVILQKSTYSGDDPVQFVISQNIHRRHLTATQRAQLAVELLAEEEKRAEARKKAGTKTLPSPDGKVSKRQERTSAAKVAKAVGVSSASVERAKAIKKSATPEVQKAVAAGKMGLEQGARVATLPKAKQDKIVKESAAKAPVKSRSSPEYHIAQIKKHWKALEFEHRPAVLAWINKVEKHFDEIRKSSFNKTGRQSASEAVAAPGAAP
jgi:hypothetical protein